MYTITGFLGINKSHLRLYPHVVGESGLSTSRSEPYHTPTHYFGAVTGLVRQIIVTRDTTLWVPWHVELLTVP